MLFTVELHVYFICPLYITAIFAIHKINFCPLNKINTICCILKITHKTERNAPTNIVSVDRTLRRLGFTGTKWTPCIKYYLNRNFQLYEGESNENFKYIYLVIYWTHKIHNNVIFLRSLHCVPYKFFSLTEVHGYL